MSVVYGRIGNSREKGHRPVSNELRSLLERVEANDPGTAKELRRHIDALQSRRQFGLNFERHTPESVALTGRPISVGDKVRFLPPRGETDVESKATWIVTAISGSKGKRVASLLDPRTKEEATRALEDLVFVADFRDPIYPGLVSTGKVERGGDKPYHAVINAENYHALEAMLFTYQGRVDCIYIDPPYNTRANDWKYNNDYVDPGDSYSHSKWLAFMERRLKMAKKLLAPSGILIVTIDEHEVHRLGLLMEQTFPDFTHQMVNIVINPKGVTQDYLSRVDEYAIFAFGPKAKVFYGEDDLLTHREVEENPDGKKRPRWKGLLRSGDDAARADREQMFYPVWINPHTNTLVRAGDWLPLDEEPDFALTDGDLVVAWPVRKDLSLGRWGVGPNTLNKLIEQGFAKLGRFDKKRNSWGITYLSEQVREELQEGLLEVVDRDENGVADVVYVDVASRRTRTAWHRSSHDAGAHGSDLLTTLIPGRKFPFPKSLYAVEDALRVAVGGKRDAIVLDFFAGSGTTAHAVMRLNHRDDGRRQSISVTNNEVNDQEVPLLRRGLRPGDEEWEAQGICERVTKPRIRSAITGRTPDGDPITGRYKFRDPFPMSDGFEENVEFFTLTYENAALVELDLAFERIAPLLWMRAGSEGRRIDARTDTFDIADTYAVLFNVDASRSFLAAVDKAEGLRIAYIVTDDETQYQAVAGQLPDGVESVRLYESYLRTFQINTGRA